MSGFLSKNFSWHFPKSRKGGQEFGKSKKDIFICKDCGAYYWRKSWYHSKETYLGKIKEKSIKFTICPACQMIRSGRYEGEIILENILDASKERIENLIRNFGQIVFEKDPMARIISIEEIAKGMFRILTTKNQLARKLAKKIAKTYKGKMSIVYSKRELTVRIRVVLGH